MSANSEFLPPPNSPDDFESLCLDLWREIWGDKSAKKNGRSGQKQAGVDVYGLDGGMQAGVQCKQRNGLLHAKVSLKEFETEVVKARKFKPPLASFVLATSGPRDAPLQRCLRF